MTLVDDPTDPPRLRRRRLRRRGAGLPAQRAHRGRRAARLPLRHRLGPARGHGVHRLGGRGGLRRHARRRAAAPSRCGRAPSIRRRSSHAVGDGVFVQSVTGVHSGVNPVSGDFSVGIEGLMIRDGVLAEPVREVTVASTLQRMLQSVVAHRRRRGVAAGDRGRPDARHRRDAAERELTASGGGGAGRGARLGARGARLGVGFGLGLGVGFGLRTRAARRRSSGRLGAARTLLDSPAPLDSPPIFFGALPFLPVADRLSCLVEAAALQDDADVPEDLAQLAAAVGAGASGADR